MPCRLPQILAAIASTDATGGAALPAVKPSGMAGTNALHPGLVVPVLDKRAVGRIDDPVLGVIGHDRPPLLSWSVNQRLWPFNQALARESSVQPATAGCSSGRRGARYSATNRSTVSVQLNCVATSR